MKNRLVFSYYITIMDRTKYFKPKMLHSFFSSFLSYKIPNQAGSIFQDDDCSPDELGLCKFICGSKIADRLYFEDCEFVWVR